MKAKEIFEGQVEVDLSDYEDPTAEAAGIIADKLQRIALALGYFNASFDWSFHNECMEESGHLYTIHCISNGLGKYPILGSSMKGTSLFIYDTRVQSIEVLLYDYINI